MESKIFPDVDWELSYRSSTQREDGHPVNVLQDFYVPALKLAIRYDRVAGYFRSSSLAAASEGFTSFVGREGHMRLIVGADLDKEDVRVILAGDQARLTERLNTEIEVHVDWPDEVKNGLVLLAWMLQQNRLEIRVAFHRHMYNREPIQFDDHSDGYVHEKWFVMEDKKGNRLYGTGSLNESRTALMLNAENIDVHADWVGGSDKERVYQADNDFGKLWRNERAHLPVMTLPDAVKAKLIKYAEGITQLRELDGSREIAITPAPQPTSLERLLFAMIKDAPNMLGGQYVGMYTAPVEAWPHQEIVARRLIDGYPDAWMLCDEVGLGKTIEAGLAIRSLFLSGYVNRVLIAAPASLTHQWQREMANKVMVPFARTSVIGGIKHQFRMEGHPDFTSRNLYSPKLNIISTGLMSRKERQSQLQGTEKFDLVLVDEAHYARRKNSREGTEGDPEFGMLYNSMRKTLIPQTKTLWMATATPMQLHPIEVYDLIALTDRIGHFSGDPTLTLEYFNLMGSILYRQLITSEEWHVIIQNLRMMRMLAPTQWKLIQEACLTSQGKAILDRMTASSWHPPQTDWRHLTKALFASSPLSRVMMRHTRGLLAIYKKNGMLKQRLAHREILKLNAIKFNEQEQKCYEALDSYIQGLQQQIALAGKGASQMMQFLLIFLRLRFASSLYAIKRTLERRKIRVAATLRMISLGIANQQELDEWKARFEERSSDDTDEGDLEDSDYDVFLKDRSRADLEWENTRLNEMLTDLAVLRERPSKMKRLLDEIQGRRIPGTNRVRQFVLFTRFLDTLHNIQENLKIQPDLRIGIYSGQEAQWYDPEKDTMVDVSHEEVKRHFLVGDIDILLCTDAAAEGLNLQTADLVINYDMGWNPMKIEQRIGRIDRIGQMHDTIFVLNFCYLGSAEEKVYGRLLERLLQANLVVGSQQFSMLPVSEEQFRELENKSITEDELAAQAKVIIAEQKQNQAKMEIQPQEQYEMYIGMAERFREEKLPVSLEEIWHIVTESEFLRACGAGRVRVDGDAETISLSIPGDEESKHRCTINRDLYERSAHIEFLTYGNPYFERLLDSVIHHDNAEIMEDGTQSEIRLQGKGWVRLSVTVPELMTKEVVAYLVMVHEHGATIPKLLSRVSDAQDMELDETAVFQEALIAEYQEKLRLQAETDFAPIRNADMIMKANKKVSEGHQYMIRAVARALLDHFTRQEEDVNFWQLAREIDMKYGEAEMQRPRYNVASLRAHQPEALFDLDLPNGSEIHFMPVGRLLAKLAMDYAKRTANSLHLTKSEVTVRKVLERMGGFERRQVNG